MPFFFLRWVRLNIFMRLKLPNKVIFLIIAVIFYLTLLRLGVRVANDYPLVSNEDLLDLFRLPQTWTTKGAVGLGEYAVSTMWTWPLNFLFGVGASLGLNFSILERVLGVIPFVFIGVYSIRKLLEYYEVGEGGKYAGIIFYLFNSYVLLLIDGGQISIALAYAIFPLCYLTVIKSIDKRLANKVLAGIAVSILGFFDIRFVYMLFLLLFIHFVLYELVFEVKRVQIRVKSWISMGVVLGAIFAGLNAYWILPSFAVSAPLFSETYDRVNQTSFLSFANIGHALLLLSPHWYKNVFGKVISLQPLFYLIPIMAFTAPLIKRKNKNVGFWILVALIGIFLVKGASPPLTVIYPWLFENIPGFSLFRDPTKFYFLVSLSYSILIGVTTQGLTKRFNWALGFLKRKVDIIPLLVIIYFIFLAYPVYTGKMTGFFSKPYSLEHFIEASEKIETDGEFGRVLWLPSRPPLGYASATHPSLEALRIVQERPFAIGTVGTYELFNFLREAPFMGELFDVFGIKYIGYPYPDTRREGLKEDTVEYYYAFLDQLTNLPWIEKRVTESPAAILQTDSSQDKFFVADKTLAVVGSDDIYKDMVSIPEFRLANNAVVFLEEVPGLGRRVSELPEPEIILNTKSGADLAVALNIPKENFFFPASELEFDPDESGWWKRETVDFLSWRNFLQEKYGLDNQDFDYGGGLAIAEGEKELRISGTNFCGGCILLARTMESARGGEIRFLEDEREIGRTATWLTTPRFPTKTTIKLSGYGEIPDRYFEYDRADFYWTMVGKLPEKMEDRTLAIKTKGDINIVNALVSVPEDSWNIYLQGAWKTLQEGQMDWYAASLSANLERLALVKNSAFVSYKRISPTLYKVKIQGLLKPVTLVFSDTYNSSWRIKPSLGNGGVRSSFPVYSLLNGFVVDQDGEYDVYFKAQKYVYPGLLVSMVTLLVSFGFLIYGRKNI